MLVDYACLRVYHLRVYVRDNRAPRRAGMNIRKCVETGLILGSDGGYVSSISRSAAEVSQLKLHSRRSCPNAANSTVYIT